MNVSLTPELERWIAATVENGRYRSASEVVREGLRLLQQREEEHAARLEALRRDVRTAQAQLSQAHLDRNLPQARRADEDLAAEILGGLPSGSAQPSIACDEPQEAVRAEESSYGTYALHALAEVLERLIEVLRHRDEPLRAAELPLRDAEIGMILATGSPPSVRITSWPCFACSTSWSRCACAS